MNEEKNYLIDKLNALIESVESGLIDDDEAEELTEMLNEFMHYDVKVK